MLLKNLATLVGLISFFVGSNSYAMQACGKVIGTYELNGRTVDVYSNGEYTGTGKSCADAAANRYGYKYQANEFVNRYLGTVYGAPMLRVHAKDFLTAAARYPSDYQVIANTGTLPEAGDVIVFGGGAYGLVGVVSEVNVETGAVTLFHQNVIIHGIAVAQGEVRFNKVSNIVDSYLRMPTLGFIRVKN